jgi:hypothetical protein
MPRDDDEDPTPTPALELGPPNGALLGSIALSSLGGLLLCAGFNFFLAPAFLIPAAALVRGFTVSNVASGVRGVARLALALALTGLLVYVVRMGSLFVESWGVGLQVLGSSLLFLLAPALIWGLWRN